MECFQKWVLAAERKCKHETIGKVETLTVSKAYVKPTLIRDKKIKGNKKSEKSQKYRTK